jgi:acetolactate synthase-1/2/3 large subunit
MPGEPESPLWLPEPGRGWLEFLQAVARFDYGAAVFVDAEGRFTKACPYCRTLRTAADVAQHDGSLSPEYVISTLGKIAGPDAVYVAGVGQHQMWAAQFISYENPRTWINSGGLGTMGFAVPAAMGAKMACPDTEVWAIDGDGCFQMTNQELATCAVEGVPIKVALINNGNLGMVRQWQTLFYGERYSNTNLSTHGVRIPDFVKLAEALGCVGLRCEREEDVVDVINQARAINDRPVVIDFIVGADAQVWPMVAAGAGNDQIMAARNIRPLFDEDNSEGRA